MTNCSLDCASISRASATCHLTKFSHRNCKQAMVNKTIVTDNANVWGEPLLLDVLTLWGQNYFEAIPIYNQGKSLLSKRKSSIGKGSSLAINIFDIKAPSELLLLITQAIWLNWLYQLALTSEMAFRIQK